MKFSTLLIESIRQSEIPLRFEPGAEEAVATPVTEMLKAWVATHLPEAASSEFDFGQKVLRTMTGSEQVGSLREHLLELLRGKGAHATFEDVTADWPEALRGVKPERLPYTPWQVLEHMRIAQWDIVEFSINPRHVSPDYPDGYWPASVEPPSAEAWDSSLRLFTADLGVRTAEE